MSHGPMGSHGVPGLGPHGAQGGAPWSPGWGPMEPRAQGLLGPMGLRGPMGLLGPGAPGVPAIFPDFFNNFFGIVRSFFGHL